MRPHHLCLFLLAQALSSRCATNVVVPEFVSSPIGVYEPILGGGLPASSRYIRRAVFLRFMPYGGFITAIEFDIHGSGRDAIGACEVERMQIELSTTPRPADGLSPVFSDNVGADHMTVFGEHGWWEGGGSWEDAFPLDIMFDRPFLYDPRQGNLLLDILNISGGRAEFVGTPTITAVDRSGDPISRVFASSVGASSGTADTIGLLTRFTIEPIPEPGSLALLAVMLGLAFTCARRRRPKPSVPPERQEP